MKELAVVLGENKLHQVAVVDLVREGIVFNCLDSLPVRGTRLELKNGLAAAPGEGQLAEAGSVQFVPPWGTLWFH